MRVLNRKQFLSMPPGTFYAKGVKWAFEGLRVKDDNRGENGFYYFKPTWINGGDDCAMDIDALDEMLETGASYPMDMTVWVDGCFDEDEVFLVFEAEDLRRLGDMIDASLDISTQSSSPG